MIQLVKQIGDRVHHIVFHQEGALYSAGKGLPEKSKQSIARHDGKE